MKSSENPWFSPGRRSGKTLAASSSGSPICLPPAPPDPPDASSSSPSYHSLFPPLSSSPSHTPTVSKMPTALKPASRAVVVPSSSVRASFSSTAAQSQIGLLASPISDSRSPNARSDTVQLQSSSLAATSVLLSNIASALSLPRPSIIPPIITSIPISDNSSTLSPAIISDLASSKVASSGSQ